MYFFSGGLQNIIIMIQYNCFNICQILSFDVSLFLSHVQCIHIPIQRFHPVLCLLWLIPFFIILLLLKRQSSGHPIRFNTTRKNTKGTHTLLCLQGTISCESSFLSYCDKHLGRIMIIHICTRFHFSHILCLLDFCLFLVDIYNEQILGVNVEILKINHNQPCEHVWKLLWM